MNYNIKGLDKATILAALYNRSRPQGMGFFHADSAVMTRDEAADLLRQSTHFDYLRGRVMKIDLSGESLRTGLYDRDLGIGAGLRALQTVEGFTGEVVEQRQEAVSS